MTFPRGEGGRGGGGWGLRVTQQRFIREGFAPRSNPLPFYIPFLREKVLLSSTFYGQIVPLSHT